MGAGDGEAAQRLAQLGNQIAEAEVQADVAEDALKAAQAELERLARKLLEARAVPQVRAASPCAGGGCAAPGETLLLHTQTAARWLAGAGAAAPAAPLGPVAVLGRAASARPASAQPASACRAGCGRPAHLTCRAVPQGILLYSPVQQVAEQLATCRDAITTLAAEKEGVAQALAEAREASAGVLQKMAVVAAKLAEAEGHFEQSLRDAEGVCSREEAAAMRAQLVAEWHKEGQSEEAIRGLLEQPAMERRVAQVEHKIVKREADAQSSYDQLEVGAGCAGWQQQYACAVWAWLGVCGGAREAVCV